MQGDCHCTTVYVMHSNHWAHKGHTHKTQEHTYTYETFQTTVAISTCSMVCFMKPGADFTHARHGHILYCDCASVYFPCMHLTGFYMLFCFRQWKWKILSKSTVNINIYSCIYVWVHVFYRNCGTSSTRLAFPLQFPPKGAIVCISS